MSGPADVVAVTVRKHSAGSTFVMPEAEVSELQTSCDDTHVGIRECSDTRKLNTQDTALHGDQNGTGAPRKSPLDWIHNNIDAVTDYFGKVMHCLEYATKTILKRVSTEGQPENNIHLLHPRSKDCIGFGLHVARHPFGCHVSRVINDGLASKIKLQENDVICKVNDHDLRDMELKGVQNLFSEIDVLDNITLTILRVTEEHGRTHHDVLTIVAILSLSDYDITLHVDVIVTSAVVRYTHSTSAGYRISQKLVNTSPKYLRIEDGNVMMSTTYDDKCRFKFELYEGGHHGARICILRHELTNQILDELATGNNSPQLHSSDAPIPVPNERPRMADRKFFSWIHRRRGEDVFQSVTRSNYYIATTGSHNADLRLRHFTSVNDVDASGIFTVIHPTQASST